MTEKVHIGFVYGKGNGHLQLQGEPDYGCCGGKKTADIYVIVEDLPDLYPSYREIYTAETVADEIAGIVREWSEHREREMWDE